MNNKEKILSFDTASDVCTAAVFNGHTIYAESKLAPRQHLQCLLPMISRLLQQANTSLAELTAIAFGQGPGNFTGLRITTSVAQGIAYSQQKKVVGVSTLQIIAQGLYREQQITDAEIILNAHMNELYIGHYQLNSQGIMQAVSEDQLQPNQNQSLTTVMPHAQDMIPLALAAIANQQLVTPDKIDPHYLRTKSAWQ